MKNIIRAFIITVVVMGLIVGGIKAIRSKRAREAQLPPAKSYTIKVKVVKAKLADVNLTLPILAVVANDNKVKISSKLSERVEKITKSRGDSVKYGDILVELDRRDIDKKITSLKSKIFSMKVKLYNLISIHKRSEELLKVDGISIEQFEKETASISSLRASISSVRASLAELYTLKSYATLKAPIDGVISKMFISTGDMAMPGKPLMEITSPKGSYIVVRVPSNIEAKSIIFRGKEYSLTPLKSTFNSLIEYRTPNIPNLVEGQRVDAKLVVYRGKGVLLSNDLILNRDGKEYVVVVDGKRAKAVKISKVAEGQEGVVVDSSDIVGKSIISAKPDILLRVLSGIPIKIVE